MHFSYKIVIRTVINGNITDLFTFVILRRAITISAPNKQGNSYYDSFKIVFLKITK